MAPRIAHRAARRAPSPQLTPSANAITTLLSRATIPKASAIGLPAFTPVNGFCSYSVVDIPKQRSSSKQFQS